MIEFLYSYLYYGALIILALVTFPYLVRTIIGPSFFDRILGANNISTLVISMICIIAVSFDENYIIDIAIIYAMLGFVTVVISCKLYLRSKKKDRLTDFKDVKERVGLKNKIEKGDNK